MFHLGFLVNTELFHVLDKAYTTGKCYHSQYYSNGDNLYHNSCVEYILWSEIQEIRILQNINESEYNMIYAVNYYLWLQASLN